MGRRKKGLTMHRVLFVRVQKFQNIEETLNEFRQTRLVSNSFSKQEGRREHRMRSHQGRRVSLGGSFTIMFN